MALRDQLSMATLTFGRIRFTPLMGLRKNTEKVKAHAQQIKSGTRAEPVASPITEAMPMIRQVKPRWYRHYLWLAPVAVVILMASVTGQWSEQHAIGLKTSALRQAAESNTLGLRGLIARHENLPFAASRHPDVPALLRQPDHPVLIGKVNRDLAALQHASGSAALFLVDSSGTTLAASNWNEQGSFVGQSYRRRPYFEEAMKGQRAFFYGLGLTTGIPGLFIAEPVRLDGLISGALVVKVSLSSLETSWGKSVDPVVLQDSRGIVFLSSDTQWMYHSEQPLAADAVEWINRHGQYGERQRYDLLPWDREPLGFADVFRIKIKGKSERRDLLALSTVIPELNWKLTVTSGFTEIRQARQEAQAIVSLLGALLVMGILYWRLRYKRIQEQQRAKTEREQREKERQLQRFARLASVGEMASTIAHELNQPLMAMSNFAVATRAIVGTAPPEILTSALDDIVGQSKRANEIVRRVRAFINPQRESHEDLDINHVISQAISMLQAELARSPTTIQISSVQNLPVVRGDRVLLEQVIVNLVQNAIHAQLAQSLDARRIDIASALHEENVEVQIADNGPGIASDQQDRLFTPFFTTKSDGLGLGLNICRTIVEAHGGHLSVRNGASSGAVFTLTLPVAR